MVYYFIWTSAIIIALNLLLLLWLLRWDIFERIAEYLIQRAIKTPYFHLEGYMERYWLVPYKMEGSETAIGCGKVSFLKRPIAWVLQSLGIAVRVHKILRSDIGRDFHNHPWNFVSVILMSNYYEVTPNYDKNNFYVGELETYCPQGSILFRNDSQMHRLKLADKTVVGNCHTQFLPVWTLFITGPKKRKWGFLTHPSNIISYKDYFKTFKANNEE
jgi:hypothetical protein